MIKFGKTNAEYLRTKSFFFDTSVSRRRVEEVKRISERYREQPRRTACVVCSEPLEVVLFILHGVEYMLCQKCNHFNGAHEDTPEFADYLYGKAGANKLDVTYGDIEREEYERRVRTIYAPKVDFMVDGISAAGEDPSALTYVDLGAGAGHFVSAMREHGLSHALGFESSAELVSIASRFLDDAIHQSEMADLSGIAASVDADVVSMIFALEHVPNLRGFLSALRSNPRIKFFYFSVPLFSTSVFLEAVFPEVMPRTLGRGHTHLFTQESIDLLCEDFGLKRASEWWFGGNAVDLHRTISIALQDTMESASAAVVWNQMMSPLIDDIQLAFDRRRQSSELHLLTEVSR